MKSRLVGLTEIALMTVLPETGKPATAQAVSNWRARNPDTFPKPVQDLKAGPVWDEHAIRQWLMDNEKMPPPMVISFINLKGGVGKTMSSVAVAECLAKDYGKRVLFIDLDPQTNATISLIPEDEWKKRDDAGRTLAHLFESKLPLNTIAKFDLSSTIMEGVSTIDGGLANLDLLPSSIRLIEVQDKLPFVAVQGNFESNPQDILRQELAPVLCHYDFIIIDCPPSLGVLTKNGLKMSTHYVIPTIPDIVSTWGIFQIVNHIANFSKSLPRKIKPLGILGCKVQGVELQKRILRNLEAGELFRDKETDLAQPPLFKHHIMQSVQVATSADLTSHPPRTFQQKYGADAYRAIAGLTKEILERCKS